MSKVEDKLKDQFPGQDPRETMRVLMYDQNMSFNRIARVLRVSSERAWRYAQQQGLLRPKSDPGGKYNSLIKVLATFPGHTPREQLQGLRKRWGSWKAASAAIGFNKNHVEGYRKLIGLVLSQHRVAKGSWRNKYEQVHGKGSGAERPGDSGRETDQD
jgi:hypothetical protein